MTMTTAVVDGGSPEVVATAEEGLAELSDKVLSEGPNGEARRPRRDRAHRRGAAKIKDMKATAAIVMHYGGNDWSRAQIDGLKDQFGKMGIEVIAVTDAGFKPEKQVADIETVMAQNPTSSSRSRPIRWRPPAPTRRPPTRA